MLNVNARGDVSMSLPEAWDAFYFYNLPLTEYLSGYHYPVQEQLADYHASIQQELAFRRFWSDFNKLYDEDESEEKVIVNEINEEE